MMGKDCVILLLCLTLLVSIKVDAAKTPQENLLATLNLDEAKCCIPLKDNTDSIEVAYGLALIDVVDFNMDTGIGDFLLWERMTWNDFRLKWNPVDFNGLANMRVNSNNLWKPDMTFFNSLEINEDRRQYTNAVVYNDGTVLWIPPTRQRFRCHVKGNLIHCYVKVGSWTFDGNQLNLTAYEGQKKMDISDFSVHQYTDRLHVTENVAAIITKYYPCCVEPYPYMIFNLTMEGSASASSAGFDSKTLPTLMMMAIAILLSWI